MVSWDNLIARVAATDSESTSDPLLKPEEAFREVWKRREDRFTAPRPHNVQLTMPSPIPFDIICKTIDIFADDLASHIQKEFFLNRGVCLGGWALCAAEFTLRNLLLVNTSWYRVVRNVLGRMVVLQEAQDPISTIIGHPLLGPWTRQLIVLNHTTEMTDLYLPMICAQLQHLRLLQLNCSNEIGISSQLGLVLSRLEDLEELSIHPQEMHDEEDGGRHLRAKDAGFVAAHAHVNIVPDGEDQPESRIMPIASHVASPSLKVIRFVDDDYMYKGRAESFQALLSDMDITLKRLPLLQTISFNYTQGRGKYKGHSDIFSWIRPKNEDYSFPMGHLRLEVKRQRGPSWPLSVFYARHLEFVCLGMQYTTDALLALFAILAETGERLVSLSLWMSEMPLLPVFLQFPVQLRVLKLMLIPTASRMPVNCLDLRMKKFVESGRLPHLGRLEISFDRFSGWTKPKYHSIQEEEVADPLYAPFSKTAGACASLDVEFVFDKTAFAR